MVEPLAINAVLSSYFSDGAAFPAGSVTFDCALIMRNVAHEWQAAADMYVWTSANSETLQAAAKTRLRLSARVMPPSIAPEKHSIL